MYAQQLSRYLDLFPREPLLVLIMEEAVADGDGLRKQLADFLGLDVSLFRQDAPGRRVNESYRVKNAGAYAAARRLGVWLRSKNLDGVVNHVRTSGG